MHNIIGSAMQLINIYGDFGSEIEWKKWFYLNLYQP